MKKQDGFTDRCYINGSFKNRIAERTVKEEESSKRNERSCFQKGQVSCGVLQACEGSIQNSNVI